MHKLPEIKQNSQNTGDLCSLKKKNETPDLFRAILDQILDSKHPLFKLANQIDLSLFEKELIHTYDPTMRRPGKSIRLMVGLHYLKYTYDLSDEAVLDGFRENPYWQYFCGFEFFQHQYPTDPSNMTRFRERGGKEGSETLLHALLRTAQDIKVLTKNDLKKVNIDATVQEKAISFPTDSRLYYKLLRRLVKLAPERGIELRQSYVRKSKEALIKQSRYAHAKQFKRAFRETGRSKIFLGRVDRDIRRKAEDSDPELRHHLHLADRLFKQERESKDKVYSIHAPEVEYISKGKAHKRYEFGVKVSMATTSKGNWVVGIRSFPGNPYDGHTLEDTIKHVERLTGYQVKEAYVDQGYRGHGHEGVTEVHIVNNRRMNRMTRSVRKWLKRRNAIEPGFGHLKSDNRMSRNYPEGSDGDQINAILSGCGFNMRKLLAVFSLSQFLYRLFVRLLLVEWFRKSQKSYSFA
jgi:IS5 family transposase